jgi:hypothetical protein
MGASSEQTHAMILSGSGAYGAFEVAGMQTIFTGQCASTHYQPLDADIFIGTSVGSINTADRIIPA